MCHPNWLCPSVKVWIAPFLGTETRFEYCKVSFSKNIKIVVLKMTFDPLRSSDKPRIVSELIFSESSLGKLLLTLRSDSLMLLPYKIYVLSQNKHVLQ